MKVSSATVFGDKKKSLIILGGSGFGREVAWLIERINKEAPTWNVLGFLDDDEAIQGASVNGYSVLGRIEDSIRYPDAYYVCAIGAPAVRKNVVQRMKEMLPSAEFATLIDPSSIVSPAVSIGRGAIICAGSIVTVNVSIGEHAIINLACTIGHDAVLNDYTTLCPSVNVSGSVIIGAETEIGTGAQIIQGKAICPHCIIGAGAVVIRDINEKGTYVGMPARKIK